MILVTFEEVIKIIKRPSKVVKNIFTGKLETDFYRNE